MNPIVPTSAAPVRSNGHAAGETEIALRLIAAWNTHDPYPIEALFGEDCVLEDCAIAVPLRGHRGLRRAVLFNFLAFPDVHFELVSQIRDGDRMAIEWRAEGTHAGRFMGIPATRRRVILEGITLLTLREGRIARLRRVWDIAGVIRQLGLLPELAQI
ncbi:MAG: ester cyclase [Thermoflexales bacterium]